ncbi:MAG: sigma-54 dependent transcriptional regulator, partial [bacterium]
MSFLPIILAIDDEVDMLETYRSILKKKYQIITASSGKEALTLLQTEQINLVLLDMRLPKMDGLTILKKIKENNPDLEVIMVTASKDIASAVEAMKGGAFDYVTKPFEVKELTVVIEKGLEKAALVKENLYLKDSLQEANSYCDLIGRSPVMKKLFATIESVGPTNSTILINGESGSGKELVARAIHKKSKRADKPFVAINCAALPDNLFESELFGHERGSFTGALDRKLGKFELADGGTLFLDEIGCMSASLQAKLLRVLEDRIIERVGGEKGIPVDVRIISATNIDFAKHIAEGKFREDLYYRLNVIPINLAPLRERKEDIPLFIEYFLDKFNKELNKNIRGFDQAALLALQTHNWPGNVRELQNLIERVTVLATKDMIELEELPFSSKPVRLNGTLKENVESYEKDIILNILSQHDNNIAATAKSLNMVRTSLITR